MKITFIGLGNMASAMIKGILAHDIVDKEDIVGADPSCEAREKIEKVFGIRTVENNRMVYDADVVILAVKPQIAEVVLSEIKDNLSDQAIILSIMAGETLAWV